MPDDDLYDLLRQMYEALRKRREESEARELRIVELEREIGRLHAGERD